MELEMKWAVNEGKYQWIDSIGAFPMCNQSLPHWLQEWGTNWPQGTILIPWGGPDRGGRATPLMELCCWWLVLQSGGGLFWVSSKCPAYQEAMKMVSSGSLEFTFKSLYPKHCGTRWPWIQNLWVWISRTSHVPLVKMLTQLFSHSISHL